MQVDLGKLFVGGISWDTDEERLKEYFSTYGEVVEAVEAKRAVPRDDQSTKVRSSNSIHEDAVDKVLLKSFHELNVIKWLRPRAVPKELSPGLVPKPTWSVWAKDMGKCKCWASGWLWTDLIHIPKGSYDGGALADFYGSGLGYDDQTWRFQILEQDATGSLGYGSGNGPLTCHLKVLQVMLVVMELEKDNQTEAFTFHRESVYMLLSNYGHLKLEIQWKLVVRRIGEKES
ncbi:hypothetical protein HAX54_007411 [Datura stramonium]|uniref:RRM domain-containing protein n=1 Tax=Datura stramonium TaxID=4076 RepID=A0ABS8TD82_DATST|nr:hypothetical protein [Datura stramonium]